MSITVSQLILDYRFLTDDSASPSATDALRLVNRARQEIANKCNVFEDTYSFSSATTAYKYTLPSTAISVRMVEQSDGTNGMVRVRPLNKTEWDRVDLETTDTEHYWYFLDNRVLNCVPRLSEDAETLTFGGTVNNTATTMNGFTSLDGIPTVGRGYIDTEALSWGGKSETSTYSTGIVEFTKNSPIVTGTGTLFATNVIVGDQIGLGSEPTKRYTVKSVDSDTQLTLQSNYLEDSTVDPLTQDTYTIKRFSLTGLVRGIEGTTAASHDGTTTAKTFYERDIVVYYYKFPTDLAVGASLETQFEHYPNVLVYWMAWQTAIKNTDDVQGTGSQFQAQYFYQKWMEEMADFQMYLSNQTDSPRVINRIN